MGSGLDRGYRPLSVFIVCRGVNRPGIEIFENTYNFWQQEYRTAHHVEVEHLPVGDSQIVHRIRIVRVVDQRALVVGNPLLQVALQFYLGKMQGESGALRMSELDSSNGPRAGLCKSPINLSNHFTSNNFAKHGSQASRRRLLANDCGLLGMDVEASMLGSSSKLDWKRRAVFHFDQPITASHNFDEPPTNPQQLRVPQRTPNNSGSADPESKSTSSDVNVLPRSSEQASTHLGTQICQRYGQIVPGNCEVWGHHQTPAGWESQPEIVSSTLNSFDSRSEERKV